jgi:hypothetical protein
MAMVFNTTFNNISVISRRSVLLVEETRVPRENHRPVTSHWQTLSHNVVSSIPHQKYLQSRRTLYSHCLSFLLFLLERVNKGYFHWILHDMGPFYLHQRDITPIKIYNFRIKSEMLKWSIMAKTPKQTNLYSLKRLFAFIYMCWCQMWVHNHIMLVSFDSNKTGVTSGAETAYPS